MNIIIPPEAEANKAVVDAIAYATEFMETLPNRFMDDINAEWAIGPSESRPPTLVLDLSYCGKRMVHEEIPPEVWQDRREYRDRLYRIWHVLFRGIGATHKARLHEMLAAYDAE